MANIQKILVPVDFSDCAAAALKQAAELRTALGATLEVLYAYDVPTFLAPNVVVFAGEFEAPLADHAEKHARENLAAFLRRAGLENHPDVTPLIAMGPAGPAIVDLIEQRRPDLVVIGTHGRTGIARVLMGSTTEKVLREATCPVLTIKAPPPDHASSAS